MNKKDSFYQDSDFENTPLEKVPDVLSQKILGDMANYVSPRMDLTVLKYFLVFSFSAGLSLFLCPQKGFGFLEDSYPMFFHFLHHNLLMCGIYCGLFFSLITHGSALLVLNHYERNLIKHRASLVSLSFYALSFSVFMVLGEDYYKAEYTYSLAWVLTVFFIVYGLNNFRLFNFKNIH